MTFFFHQCPESRRKGITYFLSKKTVCGLLLIVSLIVGVFPLFSSFKPLYPNYNVSFGAKACSMGNAFTAVADDLSAVFWNPAGIADFFCPMVYVNFRVNSISHEYQLQEWVDADTNQKWESDLYSRSKSIDFLSISVPATLWNVEWNFALSYYHYIPYNCQGEYKTQLSTDGELTEIEKTSLEFSGENGIDVLGFSLGVYLSEYFSLGLTWQHFFNSGTIEYNFQSGSVDSKTSTSEKFRGQNLVIGCLFKVEKSIQVGFCYHTGLKNFFSSSVFYQNPGDSIIEEWEDQFEIYIPPRFSLAIAIHPDKYWRLTYDFSKMFWSRATISTVGDPESELPFPVRNDYELDQLDMVNHRLGVEINFSLQKVIFFVRGGLFWEKQLFVDGGGEEIWIKGFSAGMGIHLGSLVVIDLAYMNQRANWREAGYFSPDSWVETFYRNHIFVMSVNYLFKKKTK
jgi:hypothetical protein